MSQKQNKSTINLYTIQLAQWRKAQRDNIELVDITAKSGIQEFAPDFNNVMAYKRGEMSIPDYSQAYLERMRQSFRSNPSVWAKLQTMPNQAYACYCPAGEFCHRHSFLNMSALYLQTMGFEVVLCGEIIK